MSDSEKNDQLIKELTMNHTQILKNAWKILWSYKALWVFGIILAITSASYRGTGRGNNFSYQFDRQSLHLPSSLEINQAFQDAVKLFNEKVFPIATGTLITLAVGLACFAFLLFILFRIGYYVSQTALIRMVNEYEATGEKVSWRKGFRFGWSKASWRLFLIDLVIYIPMVIVVILLFGCAALPVLVSTGFHHQPTAPGIIATIGMVFLLVFVLFVVGVALSLVMNIIRRECVLEGTGVMDAIRQGWHKVRSNFMNVFIMWLILIGISIGYFIALIPVVLMLIGVGILLGGGTGFLTYTLVNVASSETAAIVTAVVLGASLFIAILAVPLSFVGGLRETYVSATWTLTYRELAPAKALEAEAPVLTPAETAPVEPISDEPKEA
jgi:hypothetical protein